MYFSIQGIENENEIAVNNKLSMELEIELGQGYSANMV